MAEYTIGPTPRNKLIGLLADATQGVGDFMEHKNGLASVNLLSQLLGVKPIARTLDNLSYGRSLGTGTGMTWRPTADTADAVMTLAPLAKAAPGLLNSGAAAIGSRLEAPVAAMVNKTLNKGGLPAQLLQDMAKGTQSRMALFDTSALPNRGRELIQSKAQGLSDELVKNGFKVELQHSGSAAGPSSYLKVFDPETGRYFDDVRLSGHSKGVFNSQGVRNVASDDELAGVIKSALDMRDLGKSSGMTFQESLEQEAKKLISQGMKPRSAYNKARAILERNGKPINKLSKALE
jgi:hypothetical protein